MLNPLARRADLSGALPTHRDMPDGWQDAAARRRAEVDRAELHRRERRAQKARHLAARQAQIERLQAEDRAREATSVPPPGWEEA